MNGCSRRRLLEATVLAAPLALVARRAFAQEKLAQKAVQYQDTPKNGQQCSECANFVAPNACKLVQGPISPKGWCLMYTPKPK